MARFEAAWRQGQRPDLAAFLPHDGPERRALLRELIYVDLELALQAGAALRVEAFLQRFPELNADPPALIDLLAREYRFRKPREPELTVAEYQRRFPALTRQLAARLEAETATIVGVKPASAATGVSAATGAAAPPARSLAEVVRELGDGPVLLPEQRRELTGSLTAQHASASTLLAALTRRGWLTAFQADLLLRGRGRDLVLGPYLVLDRLGEGGMGQVFKAKHQVMKRLVAVKVIRKGVLAYGEQVQRFYREIEAVARLSHPNIVLAHDAGLVGDIHFFAMEYVEGIDLARRLRDEGRLTVDKACDYVRQAALGLQHAHERGLVHRDIKPSNLLLCKGENGAETVKILDLGLARIHESNNQRRLTQVGEVMGTADYIAPEQATDASQVDIRADIYSLGCTLYHLIAGQPVFVGGSMVDKLRRHQQDEPRPLGKIRALPDGLDAVLMRMLAKLPVDRFQSPRDVADALAPFCAPATAVRAGVPAMAPAAITSEQAASFSWNLPVVEKRARRRRLVWAGGGVLAALTLGALFLVFRSSDLNKVEQDEPALATNSIGMKLARIPAGAFVMGCPPHEPGWRAPEGPPHEVTITRPFYMGVFEVTQEQYEKVVGVNPSHFNAANGGGPSHPVENINFEQAVQFCHRLSELPEEKAAGRRYRLPTSAEWEYACRAGTTTRYFFGDEPKDVDAYSWTKSNAEDKTHPVGGLKANPWGLFDMCGNVHEFCSDWFEPTDNYYQHDSPRDDPLGPAHGTQRLVRGGSFLSGAESNRSAAVIPVQVPNNLQSGFRVVCEMGAGAVPFDSKYLDDLDPEKLPPEHRNGAPKYLAWVVAPDTLRPLTTRSKPVDMATGATSVAFSPDGRYLLWGMVNQGGLILWDVASNRVARSIAGQGFPTTFSPDGRTVAVTDLKRGCFSLWDLHHDLVYRRLEDQKAAESWDTAFSPDGRWLLSAHLDTPNGARLWNVQTGRVARFFPTLGSVRGVAFSPDGKFALTSPGSRDKPPLGLMKLWRVETGEELGHFDVPLPSRGCLPCFSPDGKRVACGTGDGRIRIWNLAKPQDMIELRDPAAAPAADANVYNVAFLPDGNRLASANASGRVILWDLRGGQSELLADISSSGYLDLSPDGRYLASPDSRLGPPRVFILRLPRD
ncbi:MAG: SUMF1/EgtB/PvdO family nonheme iron enzyme [Gemmataceae bacterium]|nr:SUMF1/EgtB/PvdO family nonheme iron enzyme [Gemmataceae bacterium]